MTGPDSGSARLTLARARASGVTPQHGHGVPDHLAGAAARTGRRLIEVIHTGVPMLTLGWSEGNEPSTDPTSGITRRKAPHTDLVAFAACLSYCWPDVHSHPWPGATGDEDLVVQAIAEARGNHSRTALGSYRTALRHLAEAQWIETSGGTIRLGPKTAALTTAQVDVLRGVHTLLPRPALLPQSAATHQTTAPQRKEET